MYGIILASLVALPLALASSSPWRDSRLNSNEVARSIPATNSKFKYVPVCAISIAGWHAGKGDFPVQDLSFKKYTTVTYAFAAATDDPSKLVVAPVDDPILRKVVKAGHAVGTKVTLSIGGWASSQGFSVSVGSKANRTAMIKSINKMVSKYNLDGIDFDWEYPGMPGIGCNTISPNDTSNFLLLLKELRASKLPKTAILSAAVFIVPFSDADGNPSSDVSEFAEFLDYIAIMNYDVGGPWSATTFPNAPLNDTCIQPPGVASGSAVSAVAAWEGAGIPRDQIVLGVAYYGHAFRVNNTDAFQNGSSTKLAGSYVPFNASDIPPGDAWDGGPGPDACGVEQLQGGVFDFWGLVTTGFLKKDGTPSKSKDIHYIYDNCSQTPSIYNSTSDVWVEYDDARSFAAKGRFIKHNGLRGFASWEAGGDYQDILLDTIRDSAGFRKDDCPPVSHPYPSATAIP